MGQKHASRPASSGLLLVDKPGGLTSHDAVARVRRIFGQREVGHTGTLDPMATGLLVLTLGRATRLARFVEATEKEYVGIVRLGRATTTFDAEGETTAEAPVTGIDEAAVRAALASLTGRIAQAVPAYSAVKVDGQRLYARARNGETFDTPVRQVDILELELTGLALPDLTIRARVSKGTYIRSLAVQIGDALGVPAHLAMLRRTRVGAHAVETAKSLEALEGRASELVSLETALPELPGIDLDAARTLDVRHGRPLPVDVLDALDPERRRALHAEDPLRLSSPSGDLLAIGLLEHEGSELAALPRGARAVRYACVLSADDSRVERSLDTLNHRA